LGPYALSQISNRQLTSSGIVIPLATSEPIPKEAKLFTLTPNASKEDVEYSLVLAKERFDQDGEVLMGALMFTCAARGPEPGQFFQEEALDANTFTRIFPTVPLIGYAD
jgi:small ligand-binding sensory domain FIST